MNEELDKKIEEFVKFSLELDLELKEARKKIKDKKDLKKKKLCKDFLLKIKEGAKNRGLNFKEFCLQKGYTDFYVANTLNNASASVEKLKDFKKKFLDKT